VILVRTYVKSLSIDKLIKNSIIIVILNYIIAILF